MSESISSTDASSRRRRHKKGSHSSSKSTRHDAAAEVDDSTSTSTSSTTTGRATSISPAPDAPRRRKSRTHDDAEKQSSNSKLPATAFATIARTDMSAMVESMRRANGRPAQAPSLQSMFAPPPGISPRTPSSVSSSAVPSLPAFRAAHKPVDEDEDEDDEDDEEEDSGEDAPIQLSAAASTSLKDYSHSAMRLPPAPTASDAPSGPAPTPPISLPPPVVATVAPPSVSMSATPLSPKLSPRDACTSCHKEKRRTAVTSQDQQMFLCKQCTIDVVSRDDFAVVKPLVDPAAASAPPATPAVAAPRKTSVPPPPVPRPTVPTTAPPPAGAQSSPRNALSPSNQASPRPGPPPVALRVSGRGQTPYGEVPRDSSPRSHASGPNSSNNSPRSANGVPPPPATAPPNPIYMQLSLLPPHAESNSSADFVPPPPAHSPPPQSPVPPAQAAPNAAAAASVAASAGRRLPSAARSRGPLPSVQRGPPPLAMRRSSATTGPSTLTGSGERDAAATDAPRSIAVAPDFAATLSRGMMMNVGGVPPAERKPSGDLSVPSDLRPSNFSARLSTSQRDAASSRESSRESSSRTPRATSPPLPEGAPPPTLPKRMCDKCGVNKAKKKVGTISGKVLQVCVDCLSEFEHTGAATVVAGGGESAASVPEPPPPRPLSPRPSLAEPVAAVVDPAKAAADASKRAERRVNIVLEIISSEEAYMKSLTLIEETYMARLERLATNATRTQLMKTMFSNIKQVSLVSRTLLERMWAADAQREIATCFIETAPLFQAFIEYGNTCEAANAALRELLTKDDVFRDAHEALRSECGQSLDMLLIQPVQRVPRYRMLLEDLLKNTEATHPDYENIKTALSAIQKKAAGINHHIAATEEYMAELSDLLADVEGAETLLAANRKLLFHGQVSGDYSRREPMSRVDITHHIATLVLAGETIEGAGGGGGGGEDGAATLARGDSGFQTLARSRTKPAALRAAQQALSRNQLFEATVARKHYLYLFSDIVAFAKPKGVGKKKLVLVKAKPVPLGLVWVRDMPSGIAESKRDKAWELHAPGYKWVIYSASTEDKDHWLTAARVAIQRVLPPNSDVDGRRRAMHVLADGSMYDGEWLMGLREGNGSLMHLGNRYEGTWHNDRRDDVDGRMSYATGDIYDGRWRGSMPNGVGVMTWRDGAVYQGDFLNGRMHGKGTLVWSLGDTYTGEFFQGMMHGKGTFFYNPESVGGRKMGYHGDWRDGLFHGKGILSLADGRKYNGEFEVGLRSGNGRMLYDVGGEPRVNTTSYEGAWRNGRRHGIGVLSDGVDGGRYFTGQWVDGQRHGKGLMQYGNGDKFDGEFRADLRHGTGTMTFALGAIASMEGDWHEGSMLRGTIRYRNGDEYQGPLKSNVPHGASAQLVMPNGCKFKGTWSEGRISPGSKLIVHLPDELEPLMGTVSTDASLLINADTFGEWDLPCLLPAPQFMAFAEDS